VRLAVSHREGGAMMAVAGQGVRGPRCRVRGRGRPDSTSRVVVHFPASPSFLDSIRLRSGLGTIPEWPGRGPFPTPPRAARATGWACRCRGRLGWSPTRRSRRRGGLWGWRWWWLIPVRLDDRVEFGAHPVLVRAQQAEELLALGVCLDSW